MSALGDPGERLESQSISSGADRHSNSIPVRITNRLAKSSHCTFYQRLNSAIRSRTMSNCTYISTVSKVDCVLPALLVTNACHISNKVDELLGIVDLNKVTASIVTESCLSDSIPSSAISLGTSYNIFRKDRPSPGGGVLAYTHNSLPIKRLLKLEEDDKEVLWLLYSPKRMLRPFSCIIIAGIYFPPGKTASDKREMIEYISNALDRALID